MMPTQLMERLCHEILDSNSCNGDCNWYENVCLDIEISNDGSETNNIQSIIEVFNDDEGNIINDKSSCESQDYNWFGNNTIEYESIANEVKNIDIIVGNLPPQIPTGLKQQRTIPKILLRHGLHWNGMRQRNVVKH